MSDSIICLSVDNTLFSLTFLIPIIFPISVKLNKVYGFPSSEWGIAFIVLSDYIDTTNEPSQTIISVAVTNIDIISSHTNKTANDSSEQEIIIEMLRVLNISFGNLSKPDVAILNPNNKYVNNKWISLDSAYISSPNARSFDFKSHTTKNLFNVGTHNDKHIYRFTSMESAITNAIVLSHELYPELKNKYNIKHIMTIKTIFQLIVIILVCTVLIKFITRH